MMSNSGVDTPTVLTLDQAQALKGSGVNYVGRYYSRSSWKRLTAAEAIVLRQAGLYILSIYEDGPTSPVYFTADRGAADAGVAIAQAREAGQPVGKPIYGTVDFDAQRSALPAILNYARAFDVALKETGFVAGWYGSGLVLQTIADAGFGSYWWLAESTGWAGYDEFKASNSYDILQLLDTAMDGISVDTDVSNGAAGGWLTELAA